MATATTPLVLTPPPPEPPRRSPRTSLVLAELTRQRRGERQQARARWAGWLALADRRPFDSVRTHAAPCLLFAGALPLVWSPNPAGLDGRQSPQALG
jgi:hypothetical protein